MFVAGDVVSASFNILGNDVRRHGSDLDKAVMLDENRVASEITMEDRWITSGM